MPVILMISGLFSFLRSLLPLSPYFSRHLFTFMPHLVVQIEEEEYKGANEGRTQRQNQASITGTDAGYVAMAPVFVDGGNSVGGEAAHHGYVHHGMDGGHHGGDWSGGDGGGWSGGDGGGGIGGGDGGGGGS